MITIKLNLELDPEHLTPSGRRLVWEALAPHYGLDPSRVMVLWPSPILILTEAELTPMDVAGEMVEPT